MRRKEIIAFITFFVLANSCYSQFIEDFSDGDFTSHPSWSGDISRFIVNTGKLKLQAPAASETAFLSTSSKVIHATTWEFYLQMDFNPSSTNFSKIYLTSDQANLNAGLNGYFVKAGNTADEISLYRQNGTIETKIIDGLDGRLDLPLVKMKIKVLRNAVAGWQLFSDVGLSGKYILEGAVVDNDITASSFFGVHCSYTSTRSDKFWFDDLSVTNTLVTDTEPPVIEGIATVSQQQVNILFSEPIDPSSTQNTSNFSVVNFGRPTTAVVQSDQRTVQLNFSASLINGNTYSIQVSGVKDIAGNTMTPASVNILFFKEATVKIKDIIFTEVFPDPSPQIGLPNAEFVEIYNRSLNPINLSGWKLSDGSSTGIFPSQIILPGEYWIVTASASANLYTIFGKTIGLSNFPTLNNGGESITIKNGANQLLDSINYTLEWYRDVDKQEGGWTVELIDPNNPCGEQDNWTSSENPKGGTPGKQNSVFANKPDLTSPTILSFFPDQARLTIEFDEKLDQASLGLANFSMHPAGKILRAFFKDISLRTIQLDVQSLMPHQTYILEIKDIRDCSSNVITPAYFNFGLVENADSLDVVVNEILFNPRSGGVDFVEVHNASQKFINLKNWKMGNYENGLPVNTTVFFSKNQLLAPGGFAVFTTNPGILKSQYPQSLSQYLFKTTMPEFQDDQSSVVILNGDGKMIDELNYSRNWHSEFVKNDEGVSLERIAVHGTTNDPGNWTSASSTAGFATPGFINSQSREINELNVGEIAIVPEIFSPGEDLNDFVQIQYHFDQGGWIANVKVFDHQEHLLKTIANNEILGPEGFFRWDGDRDNGTKARMGYYAIWFEVFNTSGTVKVFRKRVIVSSRY